MSDLLKWQRWFESVMAETFDNETQLSNAFATMGWIFAHADNTGGGVAVSWDGEAEGKEVGLHGTSFNFALRELADIGALQISEPKGDQHIRELQAVFNARVQRVAA